MAGVLVKGYDNYGNKTGQSGFTALAPGSGGGNTTNNQTNGTSNQTTTNNQTTNTTETDTRNTSTQQQNMSDQSLAALEQLIQQLSNGGTKNQQDDRAMRLQQIADAKAQASQYSKTNAYGDAKGAMDQQMRKVMDTLMPALTRNAEGAGTSQNAMRALLEQQGAVQASESAASLGLNAAAQYGGVANGISGILAQLVGMRDPAADALLQALGIAKGAVVTNNTSDNSVRNVNSQVNGTSTTNGTTSQNSHGSTSIIAPPQPDKQFNTGGQIGPSQGTGGGGSTFYGKPAGANSINSFNPNDMMQGFGNFNPVNGAGIDGLHFGNDSTIQALLGAGGQGY